MWSLQPGGSAASGQVAAPTCEAPPPRYRTMRTGEQWMRSTVCSISGGRAASMAAAADRAERERWRRPAGWPGCVEPRGSGDLSWVLQPAPRLPTLSARSSPLPACTAAQQPPSALQAIALPMSA